MDRDRSEQVPAKPGQVPPAGPHAKPELTNPDATPGTGMLPDPDPDDGMQPSS